MTVVVKPPKRKRDWSVLATKISLTLISGISGSVVGAASNLAEAIRLAIGETDESPSARGWVWLHETASRALLVVLREPRLHSPLTVDEFKAVLKEPTESLLKETSEDHLTASTFYNPKELSSLKTLSEFLPAIAKSVSPEHDIPEEQLNALFDAALREEGARVLIEDPAFYRPLTEAFFGIGAGPANRNLDWLRHSIWIRGLYNRQPIFSPDTDDEIPLSRVYLRLRCSWNDEFETTTEDGEITGKRRVAYVADLHETAEHWLDGDAKADPIRVVAGGPGSGKSSFARAFGSEVVNRGQHHVAFVQLQHMALSADIYTAIGQYLQRENNEHDPRGSAGLPENPLLWRATDSKPLLLIFDGLDELSHSDDASRSLARQFIFSIKNLLIQLNSSGSPVRAMILGRSVACQDALREADIGVSKMLNVAPLTPLERVDLGLGYHDEDCRNDIFDEAHLCEKDQRIVYWGSWQKLRGYKDEGTPASISDPSMKDLNAEPLLLHLLIVSDYSRGKWKEAAENRNLVYRDIFRKIFQRNRQKELFSARGLSEQDFFLLMECLGIAAWRGNGRTGSADDFRKLRKYHANMEKRFGTLESADLQSVALQIHTRRDILSGDGFEFIHKSFGEYLAGRALLTAAKRFARNLMTQDESEDIAPKWCALIGPAEMTNQVLRFLKDEAMLDLHPGNAEEALVIKKALTEFLSWTLREGMPAHRLDGTLSFRTLEHFQRCGEVALICVLNAVASTLPPPGSAQMYGESYRIDIEWPESHRPAAEMLHRIGATTGGAVLGALGRICFLGQDLGAMDLSEANLKYADLSCCRLHNVMLVGADLTSALFDEADLHAANLVGAMCNDTSFVRAELARANLRGTVLAGANLSGANLEQADVGGYAFTAGARIKEVKNLTQEQLNQLTGGARVELPAGLRRPRSWPSKKAIEFTEQSGDPLW